MTNLTRRNFVKGAAVAGSAATMLSMAACGGSDSSTTDGGEKKKVLRFGQSNAKLGLDMQKSTSSGSSSVSDCVFEAPLRWTEDNELVPCLLTEIPTFEDDGVTLHCTLKEGIKCHDGSTLTANDVKFTFERMFKPETAAKSTYMYDLIKGAKDMLAGTATELEGLTVEDDTHFTFVLESPMVTFINNLGINYAQIYPQKACEEAGDQWGWGTNCVGTGKYKIVENDDTTEVKFEKFADYHDGEPAGCWLAPATPGHDDSAKLDYDPEKAKQLLAEAGVSNLTLDCKIRKGQYEKYMTVIQSYWAEIGVTLNLAVEDSGVWQSDWADGNLEVTALGWFPLYADADNHMYTYFYSANAKGKSSFYNNPKVDELLSAARVSQDKDERASLYKEADHIICHEDFATIPLFWPKNSFAAKSYVKNAKVGNLVYHMFDLDIDTSDPDYKTA